jgi:hypothetical protein
MLLCRAIAIPSNSTNASRISAIRPTTSGSSKPHGHIVAITAYVPSTQSIDGQGTNPNQKLEAENQGNWKGNSDLFARKARRSSP